MLILDAKLLISAYLPIFTTPIQYEINYPNVLKPLCNKGWQGFVDLKHGPVKLGEDGALAELQAYQSIDIR